jgi:hypothetical protein
MNIEKLGAACFSENLTLFGDLQTQTEKCNLYRGLRAMSETIESLTQAVHKIEMQLNSLNKKIDEFPRR